MARSVIDFTAGPALALAAAWFAVGCTPAPRGGPKPPAPAPSGPSTPPPAQAAAPRGAPPPAPDPCTASRYVPPGKDTVRVAAPPAFVDRQLYETLIRFDCVGQVRPGLALDWRAEDGGRVWVLTLRPGARYWDGLPVIPVDIAQTWAPDSVQGVAVRAAGILQTTPMSERELRLTFNHPAQSLPPALADPALAVMRRDPARRWAVGTGRYRPASSDRPPTVLTPADSSTHVTVRLLADDRDPRDALDAGADLVVTDDPATVAYADTRRDLSSIPLPWSRTYALVLPNRSDVRVDTTATTQIRETLARDVVRVESRAAEPPFAWTACAGPLPAATASRAIPAPRIGYPSDDRTARDLAARIVAIGAVPARSIVPLEPAALRESIRESRDAGYVLAVPRAPLIPCANPVPWPPNVTVIPLVDTREHAIIRRGAPPLTIDWDGTLRLVPESP